MIKYARYVLIVIVLLVIQSSVIPFISLAGVTPDLLLIYVVIISLREGQIPGTVGGFLIGLASDLSTGDFIGLGALTKTIAGFVAGFFFNESSPAQSLSTYTFLLAVGIAGIAHNMIHFGFLLQGLPVSVSEIIFKFIIGTTIYTVIVSLLPFFHYASKSKSVHT